MVTIDISIEDFSRLLGLDKPLTPEELDKWVSFAKAEVDSEPEGPDENGHTKISIDIKTASRPDLWSAEGLAREVRGLIDMQGLPNIKFPASGYEITVNPELKEIRPYIAAVVARNLKLNNFLIKQLIQVQDKVDFSFGRKRKRTSIGIYNLHMIQSPIKYDLVPRSFKFVPLGFEEEMPISEIMKVHPKGQEYGHILASFEKVPILLDANGKVLSMPPIINSNDVGRVTEETTDVLIEVTGTNKEAVDVVISLLAQNMQDRGATVETVLVHYPNAYGLGDVIYPPQEPHSLEVPVKEVNKYLGTKFTEKRMMSLLRKRRHDVLPGKQKGIMMVQYGPWRQDIMHWVDLSEEIAIAADYNKIGPSTANLFTVGGLDISTQKENMIREILVGCGLQEVINYNLTDSKTISNNVLRDSKFLEEHAIHLINPVTSTYEYLRPDLLPGLIRFVGRNSEVQFPHHIFETGEVAVREGTDVITLTKAAVVLAGSDETFETSHRILDALFRLTGIDYSLNETENNYFIDGRSAEIIVEGKQVGHIGEIKVEILENHDIKVPISAFEIDLTKIKKYGIPEYRANAY